MNKTILLFISIALLLSACTAQLMPTPETIDVTKIVEQTVIVTELVVVTATPEPATATPEPTPTPQFVKWTSQDVIDTFLTAGLEADPAWVMTKEDYGLGPMVAIEGTRFIIPSLCSDCGGRILSFENQENLELSKSYYVELGKASAMFFSWTFEHDNILVQISGDLPEEKAMQYKEALENIK